MKQYDDPYDFKAHLVASSAYNSVTITDQNGNAMDLEAGLSDYKDVQTCILQELPEHSPIGALPRSVEVVLQHDMVDQCKPGDRIRVTGVYKPTSGANTVHNAIFKMVLMATGLVHE